jgi:hypothetical protein
VTTLREALDELPPTTDGITRLLKDEGVRGTPNCPRSCPLAVWLTRVVGAQVGVSQECAWLVELTDKPSHDTYLLPWPAREFVDAFDRGWLPGRGRLLV